ncbi:MAG TPA: RNA polymerase sigma factor [Kofleriaceae bacterium]|nr:RNA polymerase sigma factor [Kofleriaceae bacterium]
MSESQDSAEQDAGARVVEIDKARARQRFDRAVREHRPVLLDLARKLCRTHIDPDDLVQDVLETTLQNIAELPDDTNLVAWMTRVLRNRFIDRCRRLKTRGTQTPIDDVPVAAPVAEGEAWWQRLGSEDIRARLAALPAEQRAAFELFAFEGASYQDIAERLSIPKATVGTRILRARTKLKQLLTSEVRDEEEGAA